MKPERQLPESCFHALEQLDAKVDAALGASELEVLRAHLASCESCRAELERREALRARMRAALRNAAASPELRRRIETAIRSEPARAFRFPPWWQAMAAAAAVLLIAAGTTAYRSGHFRLTAAARDAYIASISSRVPLLLRAGLQDHVHCLVFRKLPQPMPAPEEVVARMEPKYRGLAELVKESLPADYRVLLAHECRYRARRFIHLAMATGDGKFVSVVLSRKQDGETFRTSSLHPALAQPGLPIYAANVQRFQIAGFESGDYLGFVVSDMGPAQNRELASIVASPVIHFLDGLQG